MIILHGFNIQSSPTKTVPDRTNDFLVRFTWEMPKNWRWWYDHFFEILMTFSETTPDTWYDTLNEQCGIWHSKVTWCVNNNINHSNIYLQNQQISGWLVSLVLQSNWLDLWLSMMPIPIQTIPYAVMCKLNFTLFAVWHHSFEFNKFHKRYLSKV